MVQQKCRPEIPKNVMKIKLKQLRRREKFIISASAVAILLTIVIYADFNPDLYFVHFKPLENISCYYSEAEDVLPSGDDILFPESIFFHETSCSGGLDARQACAVESAAKAHPNWEINVLFTAPGTQDTIRNCSNLLDEYNNVNFYRIHLLKYAKDTPLERFVAGGALNRTRWRISHASDVLRYLTLYKWGGVYLDLDVVVAKSFDSLAKNWAARESDTAVAAGALAFSLNTMGRHIANAAIRDIQSNYRGDSWGNNGPGVITRVLKKMCSTDNASQLSSATCMGFEVYSPQMFYPIKWQLGRTYFEPGEISLDSYLYHVWNHHTHKYRIERGSPYDTLAKMFCPVTYRVYRNDFGL